MPSKLYVLQLLALYESYIVFADLCTIFRMPELPTGLQGKYLLGYNFSSDYVADKNFCLIRCLKQRKCKSVNYNSLTTECQMNTETHISQPAAMVTVLAPDVTQYFPLDSVDEGILGDCEGHTCPDDLLCESKPFASPNPYQCITPVFSSRPLITTETTTQACVVQDSCINCMPQQFNVGSVTYRPVGCFAASGTNPLSELLANYRGSIDWNNLNIIVETCATAAQTANYKYFGIEFWGECYVESTFDPSMFVPISANDCSSRCVLGVAATDTMMVYEIV